MSETNRVLFIGSKELGLRVLQEMQAIAPGALIGALTIDDTRDVRTALDEMRVFCDAHAIDLHVAPNGRAADALVAELAPDLCIVCGWYWLIRAATLKRVPGGFLGIHYSLLPRYRGGSPLVWQMINGETEAGYSLFSFTPGMDEGPVWAQGSIPIDGTDYIGDVMTKLEAATLSTFRNLYPRILSGSASPNEQDHSQATYCTSRLPRDGNIDWNQSAHEIHNFIRAQSSPYPGAFTYFDAQPLVIWRARVFDRPYYGSPGQIARIAGTGVYVVCGDNRAVIVEEISFSGDRDRSAASLLTTGVRFSSDPGESMLNAYRPPRKNSPGST